jgi:hypothetical protein
LSSQHTCEHATDYQYVSCGAQGNILRAISAGALRSDWPSPDQLHEDPAGEYSVEATVHDKVKKVDLSLKKTFDVAK